MQRFGPPPAYPNLKIPGVNAPVQDSSGNAWSKSTDGQGVLHGGPSLTPTGDRHWGEMELEEFDEEESNEEDLEDTSNFIRNASFVGFTDLTPLMGDTRGMITGTAPDPSGYETPVAVPLSK